MNKGRFALSHQAVGGHVMLPTLLAYSLAIVGASLAGGSLPLATVLTHTRLQAYLSFAAGAMLGAAFFHMLPEAVHPNASLALDWTAAGLLALFFVERFFAFHHHEAPAEPGDPWPSHPHEHHHAGHAAGVLGPEAPGCGGSAAKSQQLQWRVAAIGLAIHSLVGGVALASAALSHTQGNTVGTAAWGVFLATLVHKPADALTIVSLMLRAGVHRSMAHLVNLAFAMMIPLGVVCFVVGVRFLGGDTAATITSAALGFSAGTFLCIALSDLLPELQFHSHDRVKLSVALLAGVGLMLAAAGWE